MDNENQETILIEFTATSQDPIVVALASTKKKTGLTLGDWSEGGVKCWGWGERGGGGGQDFKTKNRPSHLEIASSKQFSELHN